MLRIVIPSQEYFDELKEEFITIKGQTLQLEHSLVSVSKWESKWEKPFLSNKTKSREEVLDYIRCMTLTQNVNPVVYANLTQKNLDMIRDYIDASMTATTFSKNESKSGGGRKVITSEVIYYWMIALNIPHEYAKWHLNRLLTLIRVCNEENKEPKHLSAKQLAKRNSSLNAARRARHHTRG